jgi:hypothetical protein|tara:strand:- start:459 stop:764 length:306 start_codon:yes stop_codon:yes gene_type:complete
MKAWLKGGLIGAVICLPISLLFQNIFPFSLLSYLIILFIFLNVFNCKPQGFQTNPTDLGICNLSIVTVQIIFILFFCLFGFIFGAIIGHIVGKMKHKSASQ